VDPDVGSVELSVGEKTSIRLPGRATSGYRWTAEVAGDAVTVAVSPSMSGRALPGASADEIAVIEGRHPGHATVTLALRRSWEDKPLMRDPVFLKITVA
jgi:predicted secreted protein